MQFSDPKLPKEAAGNLKLVPIHQMKPYALMAGPAYVFMRRNQKFVALKSPLDFFTPEELEKITPLESVFFPPVVDEAYLFKDAAKSVRSLLTWQPHASMADSGGLAVSGQKLPPSPYELSDAILRIIGPLWCGTKDPFLEPFFVTIFVNDLCEPLPPEQLIHARDTDIISYEKALLYSSWVVFMGLHLGYHQIEFLSALRARVFQRIFDTKGKAIGYDEALWGESEIDELIALSYATLPTDGLQPVFGKIFLEATERVAQKMASRMKRIIEQLVKWPKEKAPTVFGPRGFIHV